MSETVAVARARDVRRSASKSMTEKRKPDPAVLRCSFCNKAQEEVRKLIAGPAAFICNECVEVCLDIVATDSTPDSSPRDSAESQRLRLKAAAVFPDRSATCTLCGKPALPDEVLTIDGRGILCGECADAIEDALGKGRPIT